MNITISLYTAPLNLEQKIKKKMFVLRRTNRFAQIFGFLIRFHKLGFTFYIQGNRKEDKDKDIEREYLKKHYYGYKPHYYVPTVPYCGCRACGYGPGSIIHNDFEVERYEKGNITNDEALNCPFHPR
jgi:hypothetical protein